ncbi:UDP-3-O-[3-hydroxymyristoyl] N-acetylglucosamine deacetylase [Abditibacterium utsteinense]|uniref:UDP-3-O-acyl-N-acetylglucosamine deacetylase n=1 Tax=Abditibacterium utsteinense TaxID=1960156 RepID=A0A2S8SNX7_9BACT|nr:UDP-3-O-acyl-N-acetylglucosamine deacetylase [Abditibacterium utsteinense]PQV62489.1 UDP-3-O-[3-hydroxymyristoyl] N-acetylglucosamine deacetylase [Abditibacterium utsteinense]
MSGFYTLSREIEVTGVGLHCGREISLKIRPDERVGWHFARRDLARSPEVKASLENVVATQHATVLQNNQARVSTTEHLLAALWTAGITHARIELDGEEVPILDGSANFWAESIAHCGRESIAGEQPVYALNQNVWHEAGGANILGVPHEKFRLSVAVDFNHPYASAQSVDLVVDENSFTRDLAPARTFTLENWLEPLRSAGLIRGGSLENAILIGENGPSSPLRFSNELARHKALDAVGDLALLFGDGGRFCGHLIAIRAGHGPHRSWMESCRQQNALIRI